MDQLSQIHPQPLHSGSGIDLWLADMDALPEFRGAARSLSSDEEDRAGRFRRDEDRCRFEKGREQLRGILGEYLSISPKSIAFRYGPMGKPALQINRGLEFSVSHSENLLLIAIGTVPIGADVEVVRAVPDLTAVTEMVFIETEMDCLGRGAGETVLERFLRLWTAKEAFMKGLGIGFSSDPRVVELSPMPFGFGASLDERTAAWSVISFSVDSRVAGRRALGAVAVPGGAPEVRVFVIPAVGVSARAHAGFPLRLVSGETVTHRIRTRGVSE